MSQTEDPGAAAKEAAPPSDCGTPTSVTTPTATASKKRFVVAEQAFIRTPTSRKATAESDDANEGTANSGGTCEEQAKAESCTDSTGKEVAEVDACTDEGSAMKATAGESMTIEDAVLVLQKRFRAAAVRKRLGEQLQAALKLRQKWGEEAAEQDRQEQCLRNGTLRVYVERASGVPNSSTVRPRTLRVKLLGARGLPQADETCEPCCSIEVAGRQETRKCTRAVAQSSEPSWDESFEVEGWYPGNDVELKVWDGQLEGTLLGCATLRSEQFDCSGEFDNEMRLHESGNDFEAFIRVRVAVESASMTILSASGLRREDGTTTLDTYCVCEVVGKPHLTFQTALLQGLRAPRWNHVEVMTDLTLEDSLQFSLYHQKEENPLGRTKISCQDALAGDVVRKLPLEDTPTGHMAFLEIELQMPTPSLSCVVGVPGKSYTYGSSTFVAHAHNPVWDYEYETSHYEPGDFVELSLYGHSGVDHKRTLLGTKILHGHRFSGPLATDGFSGAIELWEPALDQACDSTADRGSPDRSDHAPECVSQTRQGCDGRQGGFPGESDAGGHQSALRRSSGVIHQEAVSGGEATADMEPLSDHVDETERRSDPTTPSAPATHGKICLYVDVKRLLPNDNDSCSAREASEKLRGSSQSSHAVFPRSSIENVDRDSEAGEVTHDGRRLRLQNAMRWDFAYDNYSSSEDEAHETRKEAVGQGRSRSTKYDQSSFVVLNREDFERIVAGLEKEDLDPRIAAKDLRAADVRTGIEKLGHFRWRPFNLADLRYIFARFKSFLGYVFLRLDNQLKFADPLVKRKEIRAWREQQAAVAIQCARRRARSNQVREKLLDLRMRSKLYDSFHVRCNAPSSMGQYLAVTLRLFWGVERAEVKVVVMTQEDEEQVSEFNYRTRQLTPTLMEFECVDADATESVFTAAISGSPGSRQIRVRHGFPVLGIYWQHLPPLVEFYRHDPHGLLQQQENGNEGDDDASESDSEASPDPADDVAAHVGPSASPSAPSSPDRKEILSGWLEACCASTKYVWRWCVLYPQRLVVYTSEGRDLKILEAHVGPRLAATCVSDSAAPSEAKRLVHASRRYGFLVEPEGRQRNGHQYYFDAGDATTRRRWLEALKAAAAVAMLDSVEERGPHAVAMMSPLARKPQVIKENTARRAHQQLRKALDAAAARSRTPVSALRLFKKHDDEGTGLLDVDTFKSLLRCELRVPREALADSSDIASLISALETQSGEEGMLPISSLVAFIETGNTAVLAPKAPTEAPNEAGQTEQISHSAGDELGHGSQGHDVGPTSTAAGAERRGAMKDSKAAALLSQRPLASPQIAVVWFRHDCAEGQLFDSETRARARFAELIPDYQGCDGLLAIAMLGRRGEELRYYGSRLVYDELLTWREVELLGQRPEQRQQTGRR